MRKPGIVVMTLLGMVIVASSQQSVDITAEPSHHLVYQNDYLRAFDVTVVPKASTLVHRHDHDYVFVVLGDIDITNARVGDKPAKLQLKDGETRYTAGGFAHSATNNSDHPFRNITIDLLHPASNVKPCAESCSVPVSCAAETKSGCASIERRITSDQWVMSFVTMPPGSQIGKHTHTTPHLVVAVTDIDLTAETDGASSQARLPLGGVAWIPSGVTHSVRNNTNATLRFVMLEFTEVGK